MARKIDTPRVEVLDDEDAPEAVLNAPELDAVRIKIPDGMSADEAADVILEQFLFNAAARTKRTG